MKIISLAFMKLGEPKIGIIKNLSITEKLKVTAVRNNSIGSGSGGMILLYKTELV